MNVFGVVQGKAGFYPVQANEDGKVLSMVSEMPEPTFASAFAELVSKVVLQPMEGTDRILLSYELGVLDG